MKRTVIVFMAAALLISLSACKNSENLKPVENEIHEGVVDTQNYILPENVEAWVVEGSTDSSHAVINIVNASKNAITFGAEYKLEKLVDNTWQGMNATDVQWDNILYTVDANSAKKLTVSFTLCYGDLGTGTYRIIRPLHIADDKTEYNMACEFTLQ